jgi:hypothetical protein
MVSYLVVTLIIGVFLSYLWSTNGWLNLALKVMISSWTVWTLLKLIGAVYPELAGRL